MDRTSQTGTPALSDVAPSGGGTQSVQAMAKRGDRKSPQGRTFRPLEIIERAKDQIHALTGSPVESVSAFKQEEDGWRLVVTVVELRRIPAGSDVLADYEAVVDASGDVLSYDRNRRYFRNQVGDAA